jgi:hypothetical protein
MLLFVPLQEEVKDALIRRAEQTGEWGTHGLAVATQEGLELFGALGFLAATCVYLTSHDFPAASGNRAHFTLSMRMATVAVACVLVGAALAAASVRMLPAESAATGALGAAVNWPAAVGALLVALACLQIHAEPRRIPLGGRSVYALTAVYSLAVSAYAGASLYAYAWGSPYWLGVAAHAVLVLAALVLGVRLARRIDAGWGKAAAVAWAAGTALAFIPLRRWMPHVVFLSSGVLLLSLPIHLDRRTRID